MTSCGTHTYSHTHTHTRARSADEAGVGDEAVQGPPNKHEATREMFLEYKTMRIADITAKAMAIGKEEIDRRKAQDKTIETEGRLVKDTHKKKDTKTGYYAMTMDSLKIVLRNRTLPLSGSKQVLIDRLEAADSEIGRAASEVKKKAAEEKKKKEKEKKEKEKEKQEKQEKKEKVEKEKQEKENKEKEEKKEKEKEKEKDEDEAKEKDCLLYTSDAADE